MAENSGITAKRRGPGRPFAKGRSGNPGGRPRELGKVRDLARRHSETAIEVLAAIAADPAVSPAARVSAANALLDRAYGKPQPDPAEWDPPVAPVFVTIRYVDPEGGEEAP